MSASVHAVTTDIDARFLHELEHANLEVREHDLASASLEPARFDVVHARHVLFHISADRHLACVARLVASLRPGGAILLEESDFCSVRAEPWVDAKARELYARVAASVQDVYQRRGLDVGLGFRLVGLLSEAGVADCAGEGRVRIVRGGSAEASFHRRTYAQLREEVLASGSLLDRDYDAFLALHDDPDFACRTRTTVAAWGHAEGS